MAYEVYYSENDVLETAGNYFHATDKMAEGGILQRTLPSFMISNPQADSFFRIATADREGHGFGNTIHPTSFSVSRTSGGILAQDLSDGDRGA